MRISFYSILVTFLFFLLSEYSYGQGQQSKHWYDTCTFYFNNKSYPFSIEHWAANEFNVWKDSLGNELNVVAQPGPIREPIDSIFKPIEIYGHYPPIDSWGAIDSTVNGPYVSVTVHNYYETHIIFYPKTESAYFLDSVDRDSIQGFSDNFLKMSLKMNNRAIGMGTIKFIVINKDSSYNDYKLDTMNTHFLKDIIYPLPRNTYLIMELGSDVNTNRNSDSLLGTCDSLNFAWYIK